MKEKLPSYVVNCLQAAGFDVPEVIVDMDISQGPGNSITVIESKNAIQNIMVFSPAQHYVLPFEFPPGHRLRICKDVRTRVCRQNL